MNKVTMALRDPVGMVLIGEFVTITGSDIHVIDCTEVEPRDLLDGWPKGYRVEVPLQNIAMMTYDVGGGE